MLARHINEIKVALSPFNLSSKSAKLLLNRINTNEARKANANIKIISHVLNDPKAPSKIDVVYRDGNKLSVDSDQFNIDSLVLLVNKHAKKLEEADQAKNW
ncbi:hypothetical protein DM01DRAFT_1381523 [Hesseltinella vesiculosa]|uniref:Large ribosomal subunit protein mL53 n=1 Tax=Hesseltinella vesiculosa TaxID=101127 RepID=A0A1X2GQ79_9FUNG|nr:hypothetical protein DM01DRAFT_1381523 [Hesseltinella vesiculosa]